STPTVCQSSARCRSPCSVNSSAIRSQVRGLTVSRSAVSPASSSSASASRSSPNSARARWTLASAETSPPSSIAAVNSSAAGCGSSAIIHCSPARTCASPRRTGSTSWASLLMRTAARTWLPVRAAWNSISSNSSTPATLPTVPQRPFCICPDLAARALKRVPETAPQRVACLVVEEEVDRQRRSLEKPGLKVGRHPRRPCEHRLEPEGGGVSGYRLAERLALLVRGLHRVGQGDPGLPAGIARRTARILIPGRRRGHDWAQHRMGTRLLLAVLPAALAALAVLADL